MRTWREYGEVLKMLGQKKGNALLVGVGLCGILLLGLSTMLTTNQESGREDAGFAETNIEDGQEAARYEEALAVRLEALLEQMEGVGECTVMVTTQTGVENVYAVEQSQSINETSRYEGEMLSQQSQQSTAAEKYILLEDGGGSKRALMKTQRNPAVLGIVVVCDGGNSPQVQERVMSAVSTVTGISYNRVYVTERVKGALP